MQTRYIRDVFAIWLSGHFKMLSDEVFEKAAENYAKQWREQSSTQATWETIALYIFTTDGAEGTPYTPAMYAAVALWYAEHHFDPLRHKLTGVDVANILDYYFMAEEQYKLCNGLYWWYQPVHDENHNRVWYEEAMEFAELFFDYIQGERKNA